MNANKLILSRLIGLIGLIAPIRLIPDSRLKTLDIRHRTFPSPLLSQPPVRRRLREGGSTLNPQPARCFSGVWVLVFGISLFLPTPAPAQELRITERGPHHRVLTLNTVPDRSAPTEVVELQGGLHRWTDQGWVTTSPALEVLGDTAVARNLAYGAIIAANLATPGALDFSLPGFNCRSEGLRGSHWRA